MSIKKQWEIVKQRMKGRGLQAEGMAWAKAQKHLAWKGQWLGEAQTWRLGRRAGRDDISRSSRSHCSLLLLVLFSLFLFWWFYLFIFGERGREGERGERSISVWLPLTRPLLGTTPATQACALTGTPTGDPLVRRPELNPLSYTNQGWYYFLVAIVFDALS